MALNDNLGTRMKEYEKRNQYYLQKRTPVVIRADGRSFHTFTKGFEKPFDKIFMKSMQETAKYMCEHIGNAKFAYVQSDEITIVLIDYDTLETDCWFNYRTDKLCSISASMATMAFNKIFEKNKNEWQVKTFKEWKPIDSIECRISDAYDKSAETGAMFDARCFNIPKEEVCNLIYWRQVDATRNSIQMVGQANFSHKELQGKSCNKIQDMLFIEKGINWNDFPVPCKRGAACKKVIQNDGTLKWEIDYNIPIFRDENRKYIEDLIYVG